MALSFQRWIPFFAIAVMSAEGSAAAPSEGAPMPRIGVSSGRFVQEGSEREFIPRGFNYIRLVRRPDDKGFIHSTFSPSGYEPQRADAMLADLQSHGFNAVRVFFDVGPDGIGGAAEDSGLSGAYLDNIADFLRRARSHRIYVIPALGMTPGNKGYNSICGGKPKNIDHMNLHFLARGFVDAKVKYVSDVANAIKSRDPGLLSTVLAFELENESCLIATAPPFSLDTGTVSVANGKTYDLSSEAELQRLADESAAHRANRCADAIRAVDPDAMVAMSMFTFHAVKRSGPGQLRHDKTRDTRFPVRPLALTKTRLSYIDLHFYIHDATSFDSDLKSIEFDALKTACAEAGKPLIVGEFGAWKMRFESAQAGAAAMLWHARRIEESGFVGRLYWTYDTDEQDRLWNGRSDGGVILNALAELPRDTRDAAAMLPHVTWRE